MNWIIIVRLHNNLKNKINSEHLLSFLEHYFVTTKLKLQKAHEHRHDLLQKMYYCQSQKSSKTKLSQVVTPSQAKVVSKLSDCIAHFLSRIAQI